MSDNKKPSSNDNLDFDLDSFIESLEATAPEPAGADKSQGLPAEKFDPNATMAYIDAGEGLPELPFADDEDELELPFADDEEPELPFASEGEPDLIPERALEIEGISPEPRTATRKPRSKVDKTETRTVHNPLDNSDFAVPGSLYKPLDANSSTYKIRGGGTAQRQSPILNVVLAVIVVVGVIVLGFGMYNFAGFLAGSNGGASIELTQAQTREALNRRLPILINLIDADFDGTQGALQEAGQQLFVNGRYLPDSPDPGAQGRELISVPGPMDEAQIQGFYEGAYSAYSPEELKEHFNGAYVLDMTRGEHGAWDKVKYVNFNAESIEAEINSLRQIQDLVGDSAIVAQLGTDSRGNTVVQGTKAVGDRVFYWKIAACPFSEIYSVAKLNANAVYATCTLANYDFYTGADTITP